MENSKPGTGSFHKLILFLYKIWCSRDGEISYCGFLCYVTPYPVGWIPACRRNILTPYISKVEAVCSFDISVSTYHTTRCHKLEDNLSFTMYLGRITLTYPAIREGTRRNRPNSHPRITLYKLNFGIIRHLHLGFQSDLFQSFFSKIISYIFLPLKHPRGRPKCKWKVNIKEDICKQVENTYWN